MCSAKFHNIELKVNKYLPSMKVDVYSSDLHVQVLGVSESACAEVDNHFSKEFSTCPVRNIRVRDA